MTQGNQGYGQQPGEYGQNPGGPSYASPQYGPGSYGQPAGGPGEPVPARARKLGVTGLIIAVIGAAAVLVAFLAPLDWVDLDNSTYSDLHTLADTAPDSAPTLSVLYFTWLGWVLLVAAFVIAVLAVLPTGASAVMRFLGLIVGLAGAALTFLGLKGDNALGDTFKHGGIGLWVAIGGFIVLAIGALIGSSKAS